MASWLDKACVASAKEPRAFKRGAPQRVQWCAYGGAFFVHNSAILNKETVEFDPYFGSVMRINDWTVDSGVFAWLYPHSRLDISRNRYNTREATVDVTYKLVGIKFLYDLKDFWGLDGGSAAVDYGLKPNGSSKNSVFIDSHLNVPLPMDFLLKLHVGHQFIRNYGELDYTDWLLGCENTRGYHLTLGGAYLQQDFAVSRRIDRTGEAKAVRNSRNNHGLGS